MLNASQDQMDIVTRIIADTSDAAKKIQDYVDLVQKYQEAIKLLAKEANQSIETAAVGLRRTIIESGKTYDETAMKFAVSKIMNEARQTEASLKQNAVLMEQLGKAAGNTTTAFDKFGKVGQFVFGTVLGISAVTAIRKVVNELQQGIQYSIDYEQAQRKLEVAVRDSQRLGFDTTIAEWKQNIKSLKNEFPIFTEKDLTVGVSNAILKLIDFGFAQDKINKVMKDAISLYVLAPERFNNVADAINQVSTAVSSGNFEALQKAGINISRMAVSAEAANRGLKGAYTSLSDATRAAIAFDIINGQLARKQDDINTMMDTTKNRITAMKSAWEELGGTISKTFLPVINAVTLGITNLLNLMNDMIKLQQLVAKIDADREKRGNFGRAGHAAASKDESDLLGKAINDILTTPSGKSVDWSKYLPDEQVLDDLTVKEREAYLESLGLTSDWTDDMINIYGEFSDEWTQIQEDAEQKRKELEEDYLLDLKRIDEDYYRDLERGFKDHQDKLEDIHTKALQELEDNERKLAIDIDEENRKSALRRQEIEQNYRNNELDAEQKFQESLAKLREGFLMGLEDAIRERDAGQALRLIRQYNLQRRQAQREEDLRKESARRDFDLQISQLEAQRQERLRQLQIEHDERDRMIAIQAQRERDAEMLAWQRKQEELKIRWQQEKEDRDIAYKRQLEDLESSVAQKMQKVVDELISGKELTAQQIDEIIKKFQDEFGIGGTLANILDATAQKAKETAAGVGQSLASILAYFGIMNSIPSAPSIGGGMPPYLGGGSSGGGTTNPPNPSFGPGSPYPGIPEPVGSNMFNSTSSATVGGNLGIQLFVSPDLQAKIVENTLGQVSSSIDRMTRNRR